MNENQLNKLRSLVHEGDFINDLTLARPRIEGATIEEKAMSASVVEGYERCVHKILALAHEEQPLAGTNYVDTRKLD